MATVDGAGHTLNGQHDYLLHFPPRRLPPNNAFWSLTMTNSSRLMVANPINRYDVSDRSGLVPNADGSVDIYVQQTAMTGHESNWLPALCVFAFCVFASSNPMIFQQNYFCTF
jgi:hypothetical protein